MIRITREMMFAFLDQLCGSGTVNIFDTKPYLMKEFDLPPNFADEIVSKWMKYRPIPDKTL